MATGEVDWKETYYWAMVNAKRRKRYRHCENWVMIVDLGVGSTRAFQICKDLGVDPESTKFKREEPQNDK
jgi:hypothetical protein